MKANFLSVGSIRTSDVGRNGLATVFPQTMAAAASFDVELYGKVGAAVLGYVGQRFSYQHGIAMFGGTYALGAIAVLVARLAFFDRDKQFSDPPLRNGAKI